MDILYLLVPMSAVLVLAILGIFAWALQGGQFDDLEQQGRQIFEPGETPFDGDQAGRAGSTEESSGPQTTSMERP